MRWWSDRAIIGSSAGEPVSVRAVASRSINTLIVSPFLTLAVQPADNAPVSGGMLEESAGGIPCLCRSGFAQAGRITRGLNVPKRTRAAGASTSTPVWPTLELVHGEYPPGDGTD